MSSAFLHPVFDVPSIPAADSYGALYSFSDGLISIKDEPDAFDAFMASPSHYQGFDTVSFLPTTPSRESVLGYRRLGFQPPLEADLSTDTNSTACPETPPCQEKADTPRDAISISISDKSSNGLCREGSSFLREILTAYDETSSPVRPAPRTAGLQASPSRPKSAVEEYGMHPKALSDKWIEISNEDDTSPFIVRGWSPPPADPFPLVEIDLSLWEAARMHEVAFKEENKPAKRRSDHSRRSSIVPISKDRKPTRKHQRSESKPNTKDTRVVRRKPTRPKKQATKAAIEVSSEPPIFPANNEDDDDDDDLDMNVDIPSYIYPQPRLARRITQLQADEERMRANIENAALQEQFRAEDQAFLQAVGACYSAEPGHQSFDQECEEVENGSVLAITR